MTRKIAVSGIAFGMAALVACQGGDPQGPTPLTAPKTSGPTPIAAPPTPHPPDPGAASLAGEYTMTLDIGSGCAAIPATERRRQYAARIERNGPGGYIVTLGNATFLSGPICTGGSGRYTDIGCDQFFVSDDGSRVRFSLENNNDEAHGGHIVEQTAARTWLEIIGDADATVGVSSIKASGPGTVWYCPTASGYPFPCPTFVGCSAEIQLSLTRN